MTLVTMTFLGIATLLNGVSILLIFRWNKRIDERITHLENVDWLTEHAQTNLAKFLQPTRKKPHRLSGGA